MITITFDRLDPSPRGIPAELDNCSESVRDALYGFAASPAWPLYMHGKVGRGKTSAAALIHRAYQGPSFHPKGIKCGKGWLSATEAINALLACRIDGGRFEEDWEAAPICTMDDLGTRTFTPAQYDALLWLINSRERKPFIVTSNLSIGELSKAVQDDRIASRLASGCVMELTGDDRRAETRRKVTA